MRTVRERFQEKVNKSGRKVSHMESRCWEWRGWCGLKGYGQFSVGGKLYLSHRVSWVLTNGRRIPKGMLVCHHCDNPGCLRPSHLYLGDQKDNMRDCIDRGRLASQSGEKNNAAKLTDTEVWSIREYCNLGFLQSAVAREYGVSQQRVSQLVRFQFRAKA